MKPLVAVSVLLVATSVAAAETGAVSDAPRQPDDYGELGAVYGIAQGALFLVPSFEAGHRIHGPWWLRAAIVAGPAGEIDAGGSGSIAQGRAGIEARACAVPNILCGTIGTDLAVSHVKYASDEGAMNTVAVFAVPRVGVEAGYGHVRLRVAIEIGVGPSSSPLVAFDFNGGVVVVW